MIKENNDGLRFCTAGQILDMDFEEFDSIMNEISEFSENALKRLDGYEKNHKKSHGFEMFYSHKQIQQLRDYLHILIQQVDIIERLEK